MSWTDWLVSVALVALVVRQLRGRRVTVLGLLWPIGLVIWAAVDYLHPVVDALPDVLLVALLVGIGTALGASCALTSRLSASGSTVVLKATWLAAALWTLGITSRLAFGIWALNGGDPSIAALSQALGLHSVGTWAEGLTLMALSEVAVRTLVLLTRLWRLRASTRPSPGPTRAWSHRSAPRPVDTEAPGSSTSW